MKVSFSKEVEFIPDFNDNKLLHANDQVRAKLSPLKLFELIEITEVLKGLGLQGAVENQDLSMDQMRVLAQLAGKYVVANVKLTGLDGFNEDDVVNYSPFFGLSTELLFQLVNISSPNASEVKNS